MEILIVAANRCRDPEPVMPLGACLVAEAARLAGHRVRLLDLMFASRPEAKLRNAVRRTRPDVVGLSLRNLDNADARDPRFYGAEARVLVEVAREAGAGEVVLGGSAVGIAPEALLRFTGARWAIVGPGEHAFPAFLAALQEGGDPARLPGVAECRHVHFSGLQPPETPPPGPASDLGHRISLGPYLRRLGVTPIQTKRGCPFACVYCTYPRLEGTAYRLRDPRAVAEELVDLKRRGIRHVEVVDSVFNAPAQHAHSVCEAVADQKATPALISHNLTPEGLDRHMVTALRAAGFCAIGVTAESAADPVLGGLGKGFGADDVWRAAEALRHGGIPVLWIFLLGGPGETLGTAKQTLRFAREALGPGDAAFFGVGVRVYPGTALEAIAAREGQIPSQSADLLHPVFYFSPSVERAALEALVRDAVNSDRRFLASGAPGWSLIPILRRAAGAVGAAPPLWRHGPRIRALLGLGGIG